MSGLTVYVTRELIEDSTHSERLRQAVLNGTLDRMNAEWWERWSEGWSAATAEPEADAPLVVSAGRAP